MLYRFTSLIWGTIKVAIALVIPDMYMPTHCSQYDRFRRCWIRLLDQDDVSAELQRQGLNSTKLGTHSMRKGAATFCSSGSTACPSSTAVHLRAGWLLGGVQNTYLRYEAAGDMHVGRTVAGLPTESYRFSALAPHFETRDDCVKNGVRLMFPGLPNRLQFIAEYCLASLVYHSAFLKATLSPKHHIFETPIFQDERRLSNLFSRVRTGDGCTESRIRPTGVPPQVSILCEMKWLKDALVDSLTKIEATRVDAVRDIISELEKRAIGAGTVTYDGLHAAIKTCLQDAGMDSLVRQLTGSQSQGTTETEVVIDGNEQQPCFFWGGKFRRVPADFIIPDCSVRHIWVLWMCGNKAKKVPPLRVLDGRDMLRASPSIDDAIKVFADCAGSVAVDATTKNSRKRRRGQLGWATVGKLVRKKANSTAS